MSDEYAEAVEREVERRMLQRLLAQATADERALQRVLSNVDPSVHWESAAPDLPSPSGDPLEYQLAVTQARNDWLRARLDVLGSRRQRQRERHNRTLDSYLGGGELGLDFLLDAARAAHAAKPTPTLAEERAAGQARKDAEHAAKQARLAELRAER